MTTLYNLAAEYERLAALLETTEGELTPELTSVFDALTGELSHKLDNICKLRARLKHSAAGAKAESQRLAMLTRTRENAVARLDEYMKACLKHAGLTRYETDLFRVRVQENSTSSVTWTGPDDEIPEPYRRVKYELDAKAALAAWSENGTLPDGFVVQRGDHVRVS